MLPEGLVVILPKDWSSESNPAFELTPSFFQIPVSRFLTFYFFTLTHLIISFNWKCKTHLSRFSLSVVFAALASIHAIAEQRPTKSIFTIITSRKVFDDQGSFENGQGLSGWISVDHQTSWAMQEKTKGKIEKRKFHKKRSLWTRKYSPKSINSDAFDCSWDKRRKNQNFDVVNWYDSISWN